MQYIGCLNLPAKVIMVIAAAFLIMQIVGELLEFKGKVVPEVVKVRKFFIRKKKERETIVGVERLLGEIYTHYSEDNITKRNDWMKWVNDRSVVYDDAIIKFSEKLADVARALQENTKMTEEIFVQSRRDRILDFANKVVDDTSIVSREEFNRILKEYHQYEEFLESHSMTNGEVDIAYRIIVESYENHMKKHSFTENIRGYE